MASPTRLALCMPEQDSRDQRGKAREGVSVPEPADLACCSPTWFSLLPPSVARHSSPFSGTAAPGQHEASSPGRSQLAAGHRHWEGNHRDERKSSSQGGAKLWPEEDAPMTGLYQTHRLPCGYALGAAGAPGGGLTCRSIPFSHLLWRLRMAPS